MHWDKLAQGFGADGTIVTDEQQLSSTLKVAIQSGRTNILGARIDGSEYVDQFNALREL